MGEVSHQASRRVEQPIPREALRRLFEPKSIALIGASDRNIWTTQVATALERGGYEGTLHLVNPRSPEALGRKTVASVQDVPEAVDLAYIMVPGAAALDVLDDAAAAGVTSGVLLTSGFAEAGEEGRARQAALVARAREHGMALIGPNTLGFFNAQRRVNMFPGSGFVNVDPGPIALVSQSGALGAIMLNSLEAYGIGLSLLASTGNEAIVSVADVIEYLVDDEGTRAIALFAESINRPQTLQRAAARALEAGKPIVALKIGRSEAGARAAAAHTGAVVGDDRVIDAVFRQAGIVRVESLEELVSTASLMVCTGPIRGPRIGVVGVSGGACDIIADRAIEVGLELPTYTPETQEQLRATLAEYATVQNPLDVTGAVVNDPQMFKDAVTAVGNDPGIDAVVVEMELTTARGNRPMTSTQGIAEALNAAPIPGVYLPTMGHGFLEIERRRAAELDVPVVGGGIHLVVGTLARAPCGGAADARHMLATRRPCPRRRSRSPSAPRVTGRGRRPRRVICSPTPACP